jgi:hypothetical protein
VQPARRTVPHATPKRANINFDGRWCRLFTFLLVGIAGLLRAFLQKFGNDLVATNTSEGTSIVFG